MTLDIIYNPYAGGEKRMAKNLAAVVRRLKERDVKFSLHKTEYPKHAIELTKNAINSGATTVVAMGGDGTLNEVVNGLDNFENITFGLIPCGTGNDFANHVGLPTDVEKAVDLILDREAVYTDFIQLPTVRAINVVGMGIDVEVLKLYAALEKKTRTGYTNCLIKALLGYKCKNFTSYIDGEERKHKAFIACVANAGLFGGGLSICPMADVSDGKLEFVYIDEIKGLKIPWALMKLKGGKIFDVKATHRITAEKFTIKSDSETVVQVDGELYENVPFEAEVIHNVLKMHR